MIILIALAAVDCVIVFVAIFYYRAASKPMPKQPIISNRVLTADQVEALAEQWRIVRDMTPVGLMFDDPDGDAEDAGEEVRHDRSPSGG